MSGCKTYRVKSSRVESSQVESSQVESSRVKSSQVKSSQVKSNQVKSSRVRASQVKSSQPSQPNRPQRFKWTIQLLKMGSVKRSMQGMRMGEWWPIDVTVISNSFDRRERDDVPGIQIASRKYWAQAEGIAATRLSNYCKIFFSTCAVSSWA